MTTTTSAARTRRYRARLRGLPDPTAPQPCPQCGRMVRSRRTAPLCSRCWRMSPAGRERNRQRMAASRNVKNCHIRNDAPPTVCNHYCMGRTEAPRRKPRGASRPNGAHEVEKPERNRA
jgi:hypothetical protein